MVVFACNACGQSVKKNQVEKHSMACRNCYELSCMDCGKDFRGDEYVQHTKCVTEEEKYSGKDYKEKANSRKGEKKQEQWIQHIQNVIANTKPDKKLSDILNQLMSYQNIPRKNKKFQNFLANCLKISNPKLIDDAWKIFSEAHASNVPSNESTKDSKSNNNTSIVEPKSVHDTSVMDVEDTNAKDESSSKKKHKKRKHSCNEDDSFDNTSLEKINPNESTNNSEPSSVNDVKSENAEKDEESSHKKKKHKRKNSNGLESAENSFKESDEKNENMDVETSHKKKKNKHKSQENENCDKTDDRDLENSKEINGDEMSADLKKKFKWTKVMKEILLENEGHKMRLKHLRKKVLNQYKALNDGVTTDEEQLKEKFNKKCLSKFKIEDGFVVLDNENQM